VFSWARTFGFPVVPGALCRFNRQLEYPNLDACNLNVRSKTRSLKRTTHDASIELKPDQTSNIMATVCKHPRVRIVSRHDDVEFVECLECGEVFDSEEFNDMAIEDAIEPEEAEADS
jgi:hypothetical protein